MILFKNFTLIKIAFVKKLIQKFDEIGSRCPMALTIVSESGTYFDLKRVKEY